MYCEAGAAAPAVLSLHVGGGQPDYVNFAGQQGHVLLSAYAGISHSEPLWCRQHIEVGHLTGSMRHVCLLCLQKVGPHCLQVHAALLLDLTQIHTRVINVPNCSLH